MKTLLYITLIALLLSSCQENEQSTYGEVNTQSQMEVLENHYVGKVWVTILQDKETGHKYLMSGRGHIIRLESAK